MIVLPNVTIMSEAPAQCGPGEILVDAYLTLGPLGGTRTRVLVRADEIIPAFTLSHDGSPAEFASGEGGRYERQSTQPGQAGWRYIWKPTM